MSRPADAEVEFFFLPEAQGGRSAPIQLSDFQYRPHLQVGSGEYLGVACAQGPLEPIAPGQTAKCQVAFVYSPGVNYDELTDGVLFKVMEGSRCVATGRVLRRLR
jgi:translation elongation factor EF-Tu-like GTPase